MKKLEIIIRELHCDSESGIQLAKNRIQWQTVLNTLINSRLRKSRDIIDSLSEYNHPHRATNSQNSYTIMMIHIHKLSYCIWSFCIENLDIKFCTHIAA